MESDRTLFISIMTNTNLKLGLYYTMYLIHDNYILKNSLFAQNINKHLGLCKIPVVCLWDTTTKPQKI